MSTDPLAAIRERRARPRRYLITSGRPCGKCGTNPLDMRQDRADIDTLLASLAAATAEASLLRERLARLTDMIGRVVQEAKHHHTGRGRPLDGPGNLPPGLCRVLIDTERATEETSRCDSPPSFF